MKDDDGWIEWHGGDCPVPAGTLVDVRLRNTREIPNVLADGWRWTDLGSGGDIVAYRISKPAEPPKPDTSAEDALWREYAGKALRAYLLQSHLRFSGTPVIAIYAADIADAMLAEAKKWGRL